jgi:hypothetical protein
MNSGATIPSTSSIDAIISVVPGLVAFTMLLDAASIDLAVDEELAILCSFTFCPSAPEDATEERG